MGKYLLIGEMLRWLLSGKGDSTDLASFRDFSLLTLGRAAITTEVIRALCDRTCRRAEVNGVPVQGEPFYRKMYVFILVGKAALGIAFLYRLQYHSKVSVIEKYHYNDS